MKLSTSRIATFSMMLVLSACAMGPDYERPEVPVPDDFLEPTTVGASIANLKWWELFQSEELTHLIDMALRNNKEVAIAMARIEEARAALGFVRADQLPNLDGAAGASRGNFIPGTGLPGSINESFVLAGDLSFELDLWGKLRRSTEAARAELLATVEARNVVTITLIADVASVYLLLLDLDERVSDPIPPPDRASPASISTCRCLPHRRSARPDLRHSPPTPNGRAAAATQPCARQCASTKRRA